MTDLTLSLQEATAEWLVRQAELRATSVERLIEQLVLDQQRREAARFSFESFLERDPTIMRDPPLPLPGREERYDRSVLRR